MVIPAGKQETLAAPPRKTVCFQITVEVATVAAVVAPALACPAPVVHTVFVFVTTTVDDRDDLFRRSTSVSVSPAGGSSLDEVNGKSVAEISYPTRPLATVARSFSSTAIALCRVLQSEDQVNQSVGG